MFVMLCTLSTASFSKRVPFAFGLQECVALAGCLLVFLVLLKTWGLPGIKFTASAHSKEA